MFGCVYIQLFCHSGWWLLSCFYFYFLSLLLYRNIQFFGLESQQKVIASYVVVIGLGGVGSHAASMLLRSGVGRLLLVDFDQVSSMCSFLFFSFSSLVMLTKLWSILKSMLMFLLLL